MMSCGNNQAPSEKSTAQQPVVTSNPDTATPAATKTEYKILTGYFDTLNSAQTGQ